MLTPVFKLDQNDEFLFVNIKAPYTKINEADLFVESTDFRFYCKPYFLRLNLPGNILDNTETESGTYDFDEGVFKLKFQKETKGQHFEGLDLITKLLTPAETKKKNPIGPLIEELDNREEKNIENQEEEEEEESDGNEDGGDEWYHEQNQNTDDSVTKLAAKISDDEETLTMTMTTKYGFAQTKSNVFKKLTEEYYSVIEVSHPDSTLLSSRRELRLTSENEKFDADHYLADLYDDSGMIEALLDTYDPMATDMIQNVEEYTESEMDCLKELPKRTYLLDKQEKNWAFLSLIDILYAYCYNARINLGDSNVESGWTISKISGTLSFLDTFNSLEEVLVACLRRSLCVPLYRNWKLSQLVLSDLVRSVRRGGHKWIIKALLHTRKIFIDEEYRYVLNDLYVNDYCVWIQHVKPDKLVKLFDCVEKIIITKDQLEFDLECIELSGKLALEHVEGDTESESDSDSDTDSDDQDDESKLTDRLDKLELKVSSKSEETKPQPPSKIIELN